MEKYYSELRVHGNKVGGPTSFRTPWPMTQREGWALYAVIAGIGIAGAIVAVWLAARFMEPTLLRLLPIIIWFALLRILVGPLLIERIKPANAGERVAESA